MEHSIITRDLKRVSSSNPLVLLPEGSEESLGRYWLDRMDFDSQNFTYVRHEESLQDASRIRDQITWLLEQKERFSEREFERRVLRNYSVFDTCETTSRILYTAGSEIVNWRPQVYRGITFDEIMAVVDFCETVCLALSEEQENMGDFDKFVPKLGLLNKLRQKNENLPPITEKEVTWLSRLFAGDGENYTGCPHEKCPYRGAPYAYLSCGWCRGQVYKKVEHYHYIQYQD